ncbi:MAG: TIGR01777 family oxidoreductase [Gammaproteobacteria bacterium]
MKILITGGSGFIGKALCEYLLSQNHQLTIVSRTPEKIQTLFDKSVSSIKSIKSLDATDHFDAIINLAGEPIADKRWSLKRKKVLLSSRIGITRQIVDYIAKAEIKPETLISASAIGYYGNQGDTILDEKSGFSDDFAHQLCAEWEHTANQAKKSGLRVCLLRIGLVIGKDGGFLKRMLLPFKLSLGGRLGNGQQWMSWIHRDDLIEMIDQLLNNKDLTGVFNGTAPQPVTNSEFTKTLASSLNRFAFMHLPSIILKTGLGEMSELLLGGQRVIPKRFIDNNFKFKYTDLKTAIKSISV